MHNRTIKLLTSAVAMTAISLGVSATPVQSTDAAYLSAAGFQLDTGAAPASLDGLLQIARRGRGGDDAPGDDRGRGRGRGGDDAPGDDRGSGGNGADDGPGDDRGNGGHGTDDGANHASIDATQLMAKRGADDAAGDDRGGRRGGKGRRGGRGRGGADDGPNHA